MRQLPLRPRDNNPSGTTDQVLLHIRTFFGSEFQQATEVTYDEANKALLLKRSDGKKLCLAVTEVNQISEEN